MRQIITIAFLLISIASKGQFTKGDKVIGGNTYLYNQDINNQDANDFTDLTVSPSFGNFINENLVIGGLIELGYRKQESDFIDYTSKSIGAGIYAQRYFNFAENFYFSFIGQFVFSRAQESGPYFDPLLGDVIEAKTNSYSLTATMMPSFTFFPSRKLGFNAGIGMLSYSRLVSLTNDLTANTINFNAGYLSLGVSYFIRSSTEK